jgi:hypothetical protein
MTMIRNTAIFCAAASLASASPVMAQDQQDSGSEPASGTPPKVMMAHRVQAVPHNFFSVVNGLGAKVQCQADGGPWFAILPGGRWYERAGGSQTIIFCQPPVSRAKFPISAGERYVIQPMSSGNVGIVRVGGD